MSSQLLNTSEAPPQTSPFSAYDLPAISPNRDLEPAPLPNSMIDKAILNGPKLIKKKLNDEETNNAVQTLVHTNYLRLEFPRRIRMRVDPEIAGQTFCLISFYPSEEAQPDKDGLFGTIKVRGSFNNAAEAVDRAEYLLRNADSYSDYLVAYVGKEYPLTKESIEKYTQTLTEIDLRRKNDKIARDYIKNKEEEEKRNIQEVEERKNKLLDESKRNLDESKGTVERKPKDMLETYIETRVKRLTNRKQKEDLEKNIKVLNDNIRNYSAELTVMEDDNRDLEALGKEKYVKSLEGSGLNVEECLKYW
jgi:Family of unknown function (DUF5832)